MIVSLIVLVGLFTVAALVAVRIDLCPAGGKHNWKYTHNFIELAYYKCDKCGGIMSKLVSENDIAWLNYNKNRQQK